MATPRSVDLLPEIFRTSTNTQFLAATLDQLTQDSNFKRVQGYIGRKVGPGVNPADNYLTEPSAVRADYQLEPGVVFLDPDTSNPNDAITYPGMIDALNLKGAQTTRQDALWQSEFYSWDPFCDLDKFTNYSQYYWLSNGPDPVNVYGNPVPLTNNWDVTRGANAYTFSDTSGNNPIITLARGGNYTFTVNQPGSGFYIQAAPGVSGTMPSTPNISSRAVLGVENNGESQGQVTFNVPLKTAQDFYYTLNSLGSVDLLTETLLFDQLNNVYVSQFLAANPSGIDGITSLNGRTIVFANNFTDPESGGWLVDTQFDPLLRLDSNNGQPGSFDSILFDQTTYITDPAQQYSIWQIQYVNDVDGNPFMRLNSITSVPNLSKFTIKFGTQWASTTWYKDASGYFDEVPLLTAVLDTLWYQDASNPELFGQIQLVDQGQEITINLDEIIGAQNYTSPNGVVLTNGLKVQFRGPTYPAQYENLTYYVEGVGTGPGTSSRIGFIDGEAYFGPFYISNGQMIAGTGVDGTYQQYIYSTVADSLLNYGAGGPTGAPLPNTGVAGATVGNGIRLIPTSELVTPETYTISASVPYDSTSYDSQPYDASLNAPEVPDYITINRASQDRNAWSRSNRWFHKDVIAATATYNNQVLSLDNALRAKRPIIEFRADMYLYDFGTQGKDPVNIVDFSQADAFSNINGQPGYSIDGYTFINGTRVIFAADLDPNVRNHIYVVNFIDPDNSGNLIIDLVPAVGGLSTVNQTVVTLSGNTQQGKSFWFNGVIWILAQQKTSVNQPPLFDVFDSKGISFSDPIVYPSSTFTGSQLFGYALGSGSTVDTVLGFALQYLNINNLGDIVFQNYLYTDSFIYVSSGVSYTTNISTGFARQYIDRTEFSNLIGWQAAAMENRSRQEFQFNYDGSSPLQLDVAVDTTSVYAPVQLFIEGIFVDPSRYSYTVTSNTTVITIVDTTILTGTIIEVLAISNQTSQVGFYQVPLNLSNNGLNNNSPTLSLGTIRTHYQSIGQNLKDIQGPIIGVNNTRDLGDILVYGQILVQNSSPAVLTGVFLREQQFELFKSLNFNSQEYVKYKALLINLATNGNFINYTPSEILDEVVQEIALGRSDISPFYWSDMLPTSATYIENSYTYTNISTDVFDTVQTYSFTTSNYQGLLVYLNNRLLTINYDYTVSVDAPTVTVTVPLSVGDVVTIREYPETYGNYIPNTPTKLGLYPSFRPEIYVDTSYIQPRTVIQGHDGSITLAYGDYRDQVLLEFETRIFNNLKIKSPIPLTAADVVPGQFRTTEYTLSQINQILSEDFLSWVGWNKLDYTTQDYVAGNPFTYNYSQSSNKLTKGPVEAGAWRGIYNYFYDTYTPNTTPWEMLGLTQEPSWWENEYGPAPYTSGNLVLWDDLANGLVRDPAGAYVNPHYIRTGLQSVLPVDSEGNLVNPLISVIGNYDTTSFQRSWTFGDDGPVENTWRTSSSYPFSVMRLLALTKPAKFFSLFVDRDRYVYNNALLQYLWDGRYRLNATELTPLYGNGTSKASYLDWIIDYNRQLGINSTDTLTTTLNNLDLRLCWRVAGYTDKNYLKLYTERSTPGSTNDSLLLPQESYNVLLYKNQPFDEIVYSSIIVQQVEQGWAVFGYSTQSPYFEILVSKSSGASTTVSYGGINVKVNTTYTNNVVRVPYGYVFANLSSMCDFIASYGAFLESQGLVFDTVENGYVLSWLQMAEEFVYWSQQGFAVGSIINLNPGAQTISVEQPQAVVDNIFVYSPDNVIQNQNKEALPTRDLVVDRIGNNFRVTSLTSNTINFLDLQFTAYEHIVIVDNVSIFADLIYDPTTGARQDRILVSGWITNEWTGLVNAPGFILNQNNIIEWVPNQKYTKGQIVLFKNEYWSAIDIIQPSTTFDYSLWMKSNYNEIQTGLLPNAANDSTQLAQAYSVYDANLNLEVDLFSYGLIGFRPRQYMQALNLDDTSQVNLYQQFLGTKGTIQAAEIFSLANFGEETAQYNIYEYWAIQRSAYGATANQSYINLQLQQGLLNSNPSLVQIINPGDTSAADQTVLVQNIWKSSTIVTSPDVFPTTIAPSIGVGLPSAGYVNFNDVDLTLFNYVDASSGSVALDQINLGTTTWIAKINDHDWGVYRTSLVPGSITQVSYNLNGLSVVQFSAPHGLAVGDVIAIKYFNSLINGIYTVQSVTGVSTILIEYTFTGTQTTITGTGVAFTLDTARVAQPSDLYHLNYSSNIRPGAKVWVDNNGTGLWEVLQKASPFGEAGYNPDTGEAVEESEENAEIEPIEQAPNSLFGYAIAQGLQNLSALIGAPGYNPDNLGSAPGAVYTYVKTPANIYQENSLLQLGTTGAAGYGSSIDIGSQSWAIVGASQSSSNYGYAAVIYRNPASIVFEQWQLLVIGPDDIATSTDEFGYSVTFSQDETWLYVGAPGANRVYAYARIDYQPQNVEYYGDGTTYLFNYSDSIVVDSGIQLSVAVEDNILTYGVDYNVSGGYVIFAQPPLANELITIARRSGDIFFGDDSTDTFSLANIYSATSTEAVTVYINGALQRPVIDYTVDGSQNLIFTTAPGNGTEIIVRAETYYKRIATITVDGLDSNARFGESIKTSTDGRQIIVGAPGITVSGYTNAGEVYVFNRSVQSFQVTNTATTSYTTIESIVEPTFVTVNGSYLTNTLGTIGGTYSVSGDTVTITAPIAVGDTIGIATNQFKLIQTIQSADPGYEVKFGEYVDQCVKNCSLYIGAPNAVVDGLDEAGQVEFSQNQARVFGIITSGIANPTLTAGDYISINGFFVEATGTSVANLAADINAAGIANVVATPTADVELVADGTSTVYDVGSVYSAATSYTPVVYVNNVLQTYSVNYTYNNTTQQITFNVAPVYGYTIRVVSGRITISVVNFDASVPANRLQVLPGTGTVFNDLGLNLYAHLQVITSPLVQEYAHFGTGLFISEDVTTLIVGAPNGSPVEPDTFDNNTTYFDAGSTTFFDTTVNAGVVYTYDMLHSVNESVTNPAHFVFGQQIFDDEPQSNSLFGQAVDYTTGTLLVGEPAYITESQDIKNGRAVTYLNENLLPAWQTIRIQSPTVDINLLNTVYMYDRVAGNTKQYFDYFNPLQGRLLGAVEQNIDFIGAIDPAAYNNGIVNNYGDSWRNSHVGQIWWDTTNARFIDPNQNDIVYASARWGQLFPGSTIDVYQWVMSSVPPAQYTGPGTPYDTTRFVTSTTLNLQGIVGVNYFFWVSGINTVAVENNKTLATTVIAQYIESPNSSGISYIAPINASTIAIYNGLEYISAADTILQIEYDQKLNDDAIHVEYQLIPEGRSDGFLTPALYQKMIDSFAGINAGGQSVPDPLLPISQQYGVQVRPRQSMFANRFLALQNYLGHANTVLAQFPISETKSFNLLNSNEPIPSAASGAWDMQLANIEQLSYQNLATVPLGYTYLVDSDSNYNGFWTIYQVVSGYTSGSKILELIRVQNYDTKLYWNYIDWYLPGYNSATRISLTVPVYSALATLTVVAGTSVKVAANSAGKWEIYQFDGTKWIRVGLQDGTIAFSPDLWNYSIGRFGFDSEVFDAQFFDDTPQIETRQIIRAINEELFVDDLLIERNLSLVLAFNYILSEQGAPTWLTKTSLIDVDHTIRQLLPYPNYVEDNQDFVLNYIQEVKPYRTQIKQFNLIYDGNDTYLGTMTDFDLPAYYDTAENLYISPILDDTGKLSTTSSVPSTSTVWQTLPWNQWYQNYLLEIISVTVVNGGTGYTVPPTVVVEGTAVTPAIMTAIVNSAGQVVAVNVVDPGAGYSSTALITFAGGNGTGAQAVAAMGNTVVRSIATRIRYDRYEYTSNIVEWTANVVYTTGTQVRYADRVWSANQTVTGSTFDPDYWTIVPADQLSGVNRTMGYYVPEVNMPGLDLAQLISGIDYPGVQVTGPNFDQDTGYDVGNFDINPFDNITYGPEGKPTYDPAILDTIFESSFTDPYLGIGTAAINIDGGAFVDEYSSHAPEELVPGAVFDTLDMRVFTTPGADWLGLGHGFPLSSIKYIYSNSVANYSFADVITYPVVIEVWNQTQRIQMLPTVNYTTNWADQTIAIIGGVNSGDIIVITAYGLGGGNQIFINSYNGARVGNSLTIPVEYALVTELVIFVNGSVINNYSYSAAGEYATNISFGNTYSSTDYITVTAMAADPSGNTYAWSTPQTQYFIATGALTFTLANDMSGTNAANAIVEKNGVRAYPPEGIEYFGDNSTTQYYLPSKGNYSPTLVANNDVAVYVDNQALVYGTDFTLNTWNGVSASRSVTLTNAPATGAKILISVHTASQYYIIGNTLYWKNTGSLIPGVGDIVSVTSFNDTAQQNIVTQVFVGPTTQGITIYEGYDSTDFDAATTPDTSGSFDYSVGSSILTNNFDTGIEIIDPSRLVVTLDGYFLFNDSGFTTNGSVVTIAGPAINSAQVVTIASFTQSVVPGAIAFRIFQDMRGLQSTYRITPATTATLVADLSATDNVIYVDNASALSEPNLPQGIFGLITINGERIAYRNRDTVANTVSDLRRGTAGTAAADHAIGTSVYDIGSGNLLPAEYQNYVVSKNFLANGTQTAFTAADITVASGDQEEVQVYVGGILQTSGYSISAISPVTVTFTTAPTENYQVTILVTRALNWYEPGFGTPSNGVPLQEQETVAARFIRGN